MHERPLSQNPDAGSASAMPDGLGATTPRTSRYSRPTDLPIYSILDLEAFQHDDDVENFLETLALGNPLDTQVDDDDEQSVPDLEVRSMSTTSTSSSCTHYDASTLQAAKIPKFVEVVPDVPEVPEVPETIQALHQLQQDIMELDVSLIDYYEDLRINSVLLSPTVPPRGHVDGGALASTTDRREYLWQYRAYSPEERTRVSRLRVADDTVHIPTGEGFLKVPCSNTKGYTFAKSYYTPEIPATILSPNALGVASRCEGYHSYSDLIGDRARLELVNCAGHDKPITFELRRIRGLLFTDSLIAPTPLEHTSPIPFTTPVGDDSLDTPICSIGFATDTTCDCYDMRALTREQQRALWHMRFGHINERDISNLHKHVDGVPNLPREDALHSCPICK